MNELEKTKQRIEEIKRQAEEQKFARERERQRQEEESRKKAEKAEALRQVCEENFQIVKNNIPALLQKINDETLFGKGTVSGWKETKTSKHKHTYDGPSSVMGYYDGELQEHFHKTTQLEIRLRIPDTGNVVVFLPLTDQKWDGDWKEPVVLKNNVCVARKDQVCSWAPLSLPLHDNVSEIIEKLQGSILGQIGFLFEERYRASV